MKVKLQRDKKKKSIKAKFQIKPPKRQQVKYLQAKSFSPNCSVKAESHMLSTRNSY